jgi:ribulose-phosphate 3-epimerase
MSVIPGKAGQKFITGSEKKIAQLNEYRKTFGLDFKIGVDGGINDVTGPLCVENGVDWLVAGSYYFNATNKKVALNSLHKAKVIK